MLEAIVLPQIPVGRIKMLGAYGPIYEVGNVLRQLSDGDWMIEILMVESGETAEFRMTRMLDDPEAP